MADEWKIEQLVPGGNGMARLADGRIAFATGAFPGDRISVHEQERHKSFVRAKRWELVEPSADRVEPPCRIADRCGGCDWMRLSRTAQVTAKSSILKEALTRVGRFRDLPDIPLIVAGKDLGYRTRLRLHVDATARVGLFAKKSHSVVALETCPVSHREIDHAIDVLSTLAAKHRAAMVTFREIEIRVAPAGPPITLWMIPHPHANEPTEALLHELRKHFAVSVAGETGGVADQRWPLPGDIELFAPPGAFTQVNWSVNLELVQRVLDGAREREAETFLDLYCGAGNFTLPLSKAGLAGLGIDRAGAGIRAARRAAAHFGLDERIFVDGDVSDEVDRLVRERRRFDLVVLDPPRTGAREIAARLALLSPRYLAMCSCDPPTFARDLRALVDSGFELESVTGFDMFPHTHHVEALAWLKSSTAQPALPPA